MAPPAEARGPQPPDRIEHKIVD
jgi:hypothetical protein